MRDRLGHDPSSLERLSFQPARMVEDRQPWPHVQTKDHLPSRKCKAAMPAVLERQTFGKGATPLLLSWCVAHTTPSLASSLFRLE